MKNEHTFEEWSRIVENAKKAAESGNVKAMKDAATLIRYGYTLEEKNFDEALPYYKMAADHGDAESAYIVGGQAYLKKDYTTAFKYLKQAADAGDVDAQGFTGDLYRWGWGCKQNDVLAEKYLRSAALQNNASAQWSLFLLMYKKAGEAKKTGDRVTEMHFTSHWAHWLVCAYLNGEQAAVEFVKEKGILNDDNFMHFFKEAKQEGPDTPQYRKNLLTSQPSRPKTNSGTSQNNSSQTSGNTSQNSSNSQGGCYIATAVYGSYDCPQVWVLRRYRDNTLAKTWYGRAFVHAYYAISPTIVKWFGNTGWFQKIWRNKLDKMVQQLKVQGLKDTPYQDEKWN